MTQNNKLSKFISSIKTHIHPENTEKLENKKDTDKNVERVLELITAEESDKSELASLIKDIHKGYQALYGRYDELTENLKKKFHKKGGNGSFSFNFTSYSSESSDSDSESELSTKNSKKSHEGKAELSISLEDYNTLQQQLEGASRRNHEFEMEAASMNAKIAKFEDIEAKFAESQDINRILENKIHTLGENIKTLQAENRDLEKKLEASLKQQHELNQRIVTVHEESENLKLEKTVALNKLQESEKHVEECIAEINQMKNKIMIVESDSMILNQESEKRAQEVADLNQKVCDTDKEKEAFISENFELLSKIQRAEKALADQSDQANLNLKLATDELSSKIKQFSSENEMLKLELESADKIVYELTSGLKDVKEENGALKSEINDLKMNSELLSNENVRLLNIINDVDKQLKDKEAEHNHLESQLRDTVRWAEEEQQKVEMLSLEIKSVKNKSQETFEVLKLEFEAKVQEEIQLKQILEVTKDEKDSLISENQELLTKVKLSDREITDLKALRDQLEIEKSELQVRMENLNAELESTNLQVIDAKEKLEAASEQIAKLSMDNSGILSKMELQGIELKELQLVLEHLKEENSGLIENKRQLKESEKIIDDSKAEIEQLRTNNDQLRTQVNDLSQALELADHKLDELSKQTGVLEEEKCTLISKLEQAETRIRTQENKLEELTKENSMLQQRNKDMHDRNSDLDSKLGEQTTEILTLQKHFEEVQHGANAQIQSLSARVNDLQAEIDLLQKRNSKLEDQMKMIRDGCLEFLNLFKNLEDEITQKSSKQERLLGLLKSSLNDLHKDCNQLKYHFQESCRKLEAAEVVSQEQIKEINRLVESGEVLQENLNLSEVEKAEMGKEIARLKGQLETQSCLFKQNLKITETEYKDKEEKYRNMIEEMQHNVQNMKNEIRILSGKLDLSRNELTRMTETVESGISDFYLELDKLESFFEHKHCRIETQLSSFKVEAEILKTKLHQQLSEKQEMNGEIQDMALRLKESEEIMSDLKHEAEDLKAQLEEKEKEMENVVTRTVESDRRLAELEKTIKEKEEEILVRNKEKLEAINQLSQMIDYQQEKYGQLNEYLTRLKQNRRWL